MDNIHFEENIVYETLCKIDISKSCGPDAIPGVLLKEGAPWLVEPITNLFILSMSLSLLPQDWTRAHITPVYKRGSPHLPANYRPISLTSLVVKIMEHLIFNAVVDHLNGYNFFSCSQHGFRRGYSCLTQLTELFHEWAKSLNNRKDTHVLFLDFSRAFDSVAHQKLALKLQNSRITGTLLQWLSPMVINARLKWLDQVNACVQKASFMLSFLKRKLHGCSLIVKSRTYTSLVKPLLEYCAPVWSPHWQKDLNHIEKVQRRAVQWICGAKWNPLVNEWSMSYSSCLQRFNWVDIHSRFDQLICIHTYKIVYGLISTNLSNYLEFYSARTRSHPLALHCPSLRIDSFRYSFFVHAPFVWNLLPAHVLSADSLIIFKKCVLLWFQIK